MRPYLWRALVAALPTHALPPDGVAAISPHRTSRYHSPRSQASRRRMARRVGGYKWWRC